MAVLRERLEGRLPHLKGVACLPISVRTGQNLERLLPLVVAAHARWSTRIATATLNRWLAEATAAHPPPMAKGRRVKIRYIAQVSTRPPTFVLFVSQAGALPDSLFALSDQQSARGVRAAGRAAAPAAAHRRQPVRVTAARGSGGGAQIVRCDRFAGTAAADGSPPSTAGRLASARCARPASCRSSPRARRPGARRCRRASGRSCA